jgi:hypothetical protein
MTLINNMKVAFGRYSCSSLGLGTEELNDDPYAREKSLEPRGRGLHASFS